MRDQRLDLAGRVDGPVPGAGRPSARRVGHRRRRGGQERRAADAVEQVGGHPALEERVVLEQRAVDLDVRGDAVDEQLLERGPAAGDRRLAVRAPDDELAEQRVVVRRHLVARVEVRVHPDARAARGVVALDDAGAGPEVVRRVLGVDAELDGVAARARCPTGAARAARPRRSAIWSATRSMPVSISVTGCSTWIRQLISMKYALPSPSTRNSSVPDVLVARGHDRADRRLARAPRAPRRTGPASAPPRGSSGAGAGPSSRARRGGRRRRSGRPRPGPRRGGCRRATSRGTASRRRTRTSPRSGRS